MRSIDAVIGRRAQPSKAQRLNIASYWCSPAKCPPTGAVSTNAIQSRRVMSASSGLCVTSTEAISGSKAMPQIGHVRMALQGLFDLLLNVASCRMWLQLDQIDHVDNPVTCSMLFRMFVRWCCQSTSPVSETIPLLTSATELKSLLARR